MIAEACLYAVDCATKLDCHWGLLQSQDDCSDHARFNSTPTTGQMASRARLKSEKNGLTLGLLQMQHGWRLERTKPA